MSWQLQQGEAGGWSAADLQIWSAKADEVIALLAAAQEPDGYLDSYVTVVRGGERWADLPMGHKMFCAGHLIQMGIAHRRATGRENLFAVAVAISRQNSDARRARASGRPGERIGSLNARSAAHCLRAPSGTRSSFVFPPITHLRNRGVATTG